MLGSNIMAKEHMVKNEFFGKHAARIKSVAVKTGVGLLLIATFAAATSCISQRHCPGTSKESNQYQRH